MTPQANNLGQDEERAGHAAAILRQGLPGTAAERRAQRDLIGPLGSHTRRILHSDPKLAQALWLLDLAIRQDRADRQTTSLQWALPAIMGSALPGAIGFLLLLSAEIVSASSVTTSGDRIQPRQPGNSHSLAKPHPASSVSGQPVS